MNIFEFKIAHVEEAELPTVMEATQPTGEYKTIYVMAETEEDACNRADDYVSKTKYVDIEDKKIVR